MIRRDDSDRLVALKVDVGMMVEGIRRSTDLGDERERAFPAFEDVGLADLGSVALPAIQVREELRPERLGQGLFALRDGHGVILATLTTCELPAPGARRPERRFRGRGPAPSQ